MTDVSFLYPVGSKLVLVGAPRLGGMTSMCLSLDIWLSESLGTLSVSLLKHTLKCPPFNPLGLKCLLYKTATAKPYLWQGRCKAKIITSLEAFSYYSELD